jgi:hypothetical protein
MLDAYEMLKVFGCLIIRRSSSLPHQSHRPNVDEGAKEKGRKKLLKRTEEKRKRKI